MASRRDSTLFRGLRQTTTLDSGAPLNTNAPNEKPVSNLVDSLSDRLFKKDYLDRKLERHHITGIYLPSNAKSHLTI